MTPNGSRGISERTDPTADSEALEQAWLRVSWAAGPELDTTVSRDEVNLEIEAHDVD